METLVDNAIEFWTKVGKENGWKLGKRGVTVWIDEDGNQVDSLYNAPNNENVSYIIDYKTEKIIKRIWKNNYKML